MENLKDSKPNTVSSEIEQNTVLSGKRTKLKLKRDEMLGTFRMKFRILKVTCPININRNIAVRESVLTMIVVWYVHAVRINNYHLFSSLPKLVKNTKKRVLYKYELDCSFSVSNIKKERSCT